MGEKVSFGPAFVKWVHMPHSSPYKKNSTSGISLSASMKYLFENKYCVGFFFERMLNKIMNSLWQTFVCLVGLLHLIPSTENLLFPQKPTKLQINITVTTIFGLLLLAPLHISALASSANVFFSSGWN